jgi:iron complex outermembrane recepter protein
MKACSINRSGAGLRSALLVSAGCFALISHGAAYAQNAPNVNPSGPDAGAQDSQADNSEILVTARKRSEKLTDIPDQVSVFSAEAIAESGVDSVQDMASSLSNFSLVKTQNPGTVFLNLRGIGQYRNSEAPVAIVIDGVQLVSTDAITQELFDIEQIEVLKGPQGAIFGRNASAGAINIVTKKPGNDFEGSLEASYANGSELRGRAMISGPIIEDKLFARLSLSASHFDGLIDNVTTGRPADFSKDRNARLRIIATPTDTLTLDFRGSYSKLHAGSSYFIPIVDQGGFALNGVANDFRFPVQTDTEGRSDRKLQEYALKIEQDLGFATLTSVTARSLTDEDFFQDLDFTAAPVINFGQVRSVRAWSEEVRLTSNGGGRFNWMLGGYYLDNKRQIDTNVFISLANIGLYAAPGFSGGTNSLSAFNFTAPVDLQTVDLSNLESNKNTAIFGNVGYDLTDSITLSIGARYDRDKRQQLNLDTGEVQRKTFSLLQPKVQLSYKPTDSLNIYASWGRGFRSGGFNQDDIVRGFYDAEEVSTSEVGFKSEWADRRLTINGALFHTTFKNRQDFQFILGVQTVLTIPKARINGGEIEIKYNPVEGLDLYANAGFLNTRIGANPIGLDPTVTGLPAGFSFIGNKIPLAYGWSYATGVQYKHSIGTDADLVWRVDYNAHGDLAWELGNQDRQKPVHLVDTRLTLKLSTFDIGLWSQNLFNKKYYQEFVSREFSALATDLGFPASPRRYGVSISTRF